METIKVGIREFRNHLPHYILEAGCPVAVTRHGQTVGYFIPSGSGKKADEITALVSAASLLDELLTSRQVTEDELMEEFRRLRARK